MSERVVMVMVLLLLVGCGSSPSRPKAFTEGERLLRKGVAAYHDDELLAAAGFFTRALLHYQGIDDRRGQLQSRIDLVEVSLAVGNLDAAQRHLEQAELLAVDGLTGYRPRLVLLRSSLALARGDIASASELSESLLPAKLGGSGQIKADESLQRQALINRTVVAFAQSSDDAAQWVVRLDGAAHGDQLSEARLARFHAALARRQGDTAVASQQLQQALDLCKAIPARSCIASTLEEWGALLQATDELAGAEEHYQRALAVRLALLDRGGVGADLRQLAAINQRAGHEDQAATFSQWADAMAGDAAVDWGRLRREILPQ